MNEIRLMLVDDHDVVRTGLKAYLNNQQDMSVVCEAGDGLSAVQIAQEFHPDIIVMDISMPGIDGIEASRRLKEILPEVKILALTVHVDKQYFLEMINAGAKGYVSKQSVADELLTAIRAIAAGGVHLPPIFASWLLDDYQRLINQHNPRGGYQDAAPPMGKSLKTLSRRELQVLELVAMGKTNVQSGEILEISPKTVARHRERIMTKLGIHSSVELVRYAIRNGLVTLA